MRCLRIALYTPVSVTLPIAYNQLVQGLLYSCWRDAYPDVHGSTQSGATSMPPFTFGPLEEDIRINAKSKTVQLNGIVSFEVRSPHEELVEEVAVRLSSFAHIRLGAHELELVNLESKDRLLFPQRSRIRMRSPVVAYRTTEDRHTLYFSPADSEWIDLINANVQKKAQAHGVPFDRPLQIIPTSKSQREHMTRFKGTYIKGWTGTMIVDATPDILAMLWTMGLGSKNSQGFGMFDILERPL